MWFHMDPVSLEWLERAPGTMRFTRELDAPPARAFDVAAKGERQETWFHDFKGSRWTSGREAVGAERVVRLKLLSVRERFLVWEPGARATFTMFGITLPLVTRMAEDLRFEPLDGGARTRLTWSVAYEPRGPLKRARPLLEKAFAPMFDQSLASLARYLRP